MTRRNFVIGLECRNLIAEAAQRHLPLKITNKQEKRWQVYNSNFLEVQSNRVIMSMPVPDDKGCYLEITEGQEMAITFKKGYRKCLFLTRVIGRTEYQIDEGVSVPSIVALCPQQIERFQRRAFNRAEVPEGEPVIVEISSLESGAGDLKFSGQLFNLSAGGLGVTVLQSEMPEIEEDQQFEMRFVPLENQEEICVQARFRHATEQPEDEKLMLGFHIIGLEMTEQGRSVLRRISRVVSLYQRQKTISEHPGLSK